MSAPVSQSITRRSASNLALAFILLPEEKRRAMSTLYAFCREVDDIADDDAAPTDVRRSRLAAWRAELHAAYDHRQPTLPVLRELQPCIARYQLPLSVFEDLLAGVEMDLDINRYPSHEQLDLYCYRVASAVGLLSIEIFGYKNPGCRTYALHLGRALQLTNILRDVATDAARNRIYLPLDQLQRFAVRPEEILEGRYSDRFQRLAESIADRATRFYQQARAALPPEDRHSMIAAELMGSVYWQLLRRIQARGFDVFSTRIRLSRLAKIRLVLRTWWRFKTGSASPNYG